jgi:hypothetical protein
MPALGADNPCSVHPPPRDEDKQIATQEKYAGMKARLCIVLFLSAVLCAHAEPYGDFTYIVNGSNAEITAYSGSGGDIGIPGTINGMPVVIGDNVLRNCATLADVTISNGVIRIGSSAFDRCSMARVAIPSSVNDIRNRAFAECANLTNITVDGANAAYSSTNGVLFNKGQTLLIQCPAGISGNYAVPAGVAIIGDSAFRYCRLLTRVTIPEGVGEIRGTAFFGCFDLAMVSIPNSIGSIGFAAFMACSSLTNVTLSANVTAVGDSAFSGCDSLAGITVDDANTAYSSTNGVLFNKGQTLLIQYPGGKAGTFTIPASVTTIQERAFITSYGLVAIDVDGANAYYSSTNGVLFSKDGTMLIQCPGGKAGEYTVPAGVSNIGKRAFAACHSLTDVTIPASVTNIGERAFEDGRLTGVYFLGNAPAITGNIFDGCGDDLSVYVLTGATGWDAPFAGYPATPWPPEISAAGQDSQTGHFGFQADWVVGMKATFEACTNLVNPDWLPLQTNTFTNASVHFSDPQWTNHPNRFYRLLQVP